MLLPTVAAVAAVTDIDIITVAVESASFTIGDGCGDVDTAAVVVVAGVAAVVGTNYSCCWNS